MTYLVRRCPSCDSPISYKNTYAGQRNFKRAEAENRLCKRCTMKRERISQADSWLNEESVKKKSESLKLAHAKPDAPWKTQEWRENQSKSMIQHALSGTHPFQLFTREKIMEMSAKTWATNLTSGSNFQKHVEWRNTDEGHEWLSHIAKKFRAENPIFQSEEYKQKIKSHLTQARKLVRKKKSSRHERALAEALHKANSDFVLNEAGPNINVGPYHPDIVNEKCKIVVEFYGDYSHSNPNLYAEDSWNGLRCKTAREMHEHDTKRNAFIESEGWRVIVVWESDWKKSNEDVVNKIIKEANDVVNH